MTTITAPKGWRADTIEHRFASGRASSYNASEHSALCVISAGAAVRRVYGTEVLKITRDAIDLSRLPVPLLDSHSQRSIDSVLGVIETAWIAGGKLHGKIRFAQTPRGRLAEGMVARGELTGISAGYRVDTWSVTDADGDIVDESRAGWDDDLTFTATRWQLYEGSLVGVPADIDSAVRKLVAGIGREYAVDVKVAADSGHVGQTRARMEGGDECISACWMRNDKRAKRLSSAGSISSAEPAVCRA